MAVPSPSTSKSELRAEALARRGAFVDSLTEALRCAEETALARMIFPHLSFARTIGLYHPLRGEISALGLTEMLAPSQNHALPWFANRDARMMWREGPAAEAGPWGVLQPAVEATPLSPDLVIVPLVLADRRGARIGHGKGHYDRALKHLRASGAVTAIGVGWDWQVVDGPIPADPWDVRLDAIATPREWIECV
ncbi:MAG: 5-formyltetrahydrofolate cyclo-ligase [Sphingomonas sp.]